MRPTSRCEMTSSGWDAEVHLLAGYIANRNLAIGPAHCIERRTDGMPVAIGRNIWLAQAEDLLPPDSLLACCRGARKDEFLTSANRLKLMLRRTLHSNIASFTSEDVCTKCAKLNSHTALYSLQHDRLLHQTTQKIMLGRGSSSPSSLQLPADTSQSAQHEALNARLTECQ